jgi:hypothetical protein
LVRPISSSFRRIVPQKIFLYRKESVMVVPTGTHEEQDVEHCWLTQAEAGDRTRSLGGCTSGGRNVTMSSSGEPKGHVRHHSGLIFSGIVLGSSVLIELLFVGFVELPVVFIFYPLSVLHA